MRSISRVPRCQQRNNSRLRRSSRPLLDRVEPVISHFQSNAKSPDVPGGVDIASGSVNVSRRWCEKSGIYWLRRHPTRQIASVDVIGALRPVVMGPRLRGDGQRIASGHQRRPCGRRDPYTVLLVLKELFDDIAQNCSLWLWVPACAGTTSGEVAAITSASSLRTQGPIRRVARVERCCWTTSAETTPCGYGSPRARGRRMVSGGRGNPRGETTREGLRSRGANASELCKTFRPRRAWGMPG